MPLNLAFFLSRATPLAHWSTMGTLSREIALYQTLQKKGVAVTFVTSGDQHECAFQAQMGEISILYNRFRLPANLYSLLAPFVHWRVLRKADIFKCNQLDGAWTTVLAGKLFGKPSIVRAGYLWVENFERITGRNWRTRLMRQLATFSLRQASAVFVTTHEIGAALSANYGLESERIHTIPNIIDTNLFSPDHSQTTVSNQILFIGRLSPEKNVDLLIEAISRVPGASLVIVGDGPLRGTLEQLAQDHAAAVTFLGRRPNQELPALLRQSELFALPSHFEGHPKVLLEAMSCGLAVLGNDVEGINTLIKHQDTGWLSQPTVSDWQEAISLLLADAPARAELGRNARAFVLEHFELESVACRELAILQSLAHTTGDN